MKRYEIPRPCINCYNMQAWSLDMDGDHDFTCQKKPPSEYGKMDCDKYILREDIEREQERIRSLMKGTEA